MITLTGFHYNSRFIRHHSICHHDRNNKVSLFFFPNDSGLVVTSGPFTLITSFAPYPSVSWRSVTLNSSIHTSQNKRFEFVWALFHVSTKQGQFSHTQDKLGKVPIAYKKQGAQEDQKFRKRELLRLKIKIKVPTKIQM